MNPFRIFPMCVAVATVLGLSACQTHPKLTPRPVTLNQRKCPVPPQYPAIAMRRDLQGTVILSGIVALDGSVSDVKIVESLASASMPTIEAAAAKALDDAAITFFKQCRFAPVTGDYAPVSVRLPVQFVLQ